MKFRRKTISVKQNFPGRPLKVIVVGNQESGNALLSLQQEDKRHPSIRLQSQRVDALLNLTEIDKLIFCLTTIKNEILADGKT